MLLFHIVHFGKKQRTKFGNIIKQIIGFIGVNMYFVFIVAVDNNQTVAVMSNFFLQLIFRSNYITFEHKFGTVFIFYFRIP